MDIKSFQNELNNLNYKSIIKNRNELYVSCDKSNAKERVVYLLNQYKLKFISEFCYETKIKDVFKINIVLSNRKVGQIVIVTYQTKDCIISFQDLFQQSHLFEREISDLFGLSIKDGNDKRYLIKHEIWEKDIFPLRKGCQYGTKVKEKHEIPNYKFKTIRGDEGFQIPVGPIHAGIIEPGHFRFSAIGEDIENLEIRFNYKHRGIEKIAENIDANKLNILFERVACESTVAYAESYALLIEKLLKKDVSKDVQCLRVVLLEMERVYNFLNDLGGICVDIGYSYPAKKLSYLSEAVKQLAERVTGSRYMRNVIVPLGINIDFDEEKANDIRETLKKIESRANYILSITLESFSFLDRVEHTGMVSTKKAKKLVLTGVVGRASGVNYDVRKSFPYEIYYDIKKENNTEKIGGVFERYKVKIAEVKDAFKFINISLDTIKSTINGEKNKFILGEGEEAISMVETVKGELMVYGRVGKNNTFDRLYLKTPSFTNWEGITVAVLDEIVPDFPLCNKSFNLSYSENDR